MLDDNASVEGYNIDAREKKTPVQYSCYGKFAYMRYKKTKRRKKKKKERNARHTNITIADYSRQRCYL
jgi:hypothetical protein